VGSQVRPDWRVKCHPASRNHFIVFAEDPAQKAELDSFVGYCRPGMQFLDVGAHYGLFSLAAVHFGGPGSRAVCVEASPKAASILHANVEANAVARQILIFEVAMGATDGTLEMLSTGPAGSDYFVSAPKGRADTVSVRELSMSSVLRESKLAPTHVKMDIEGFDSDVIAGAAQLFREYRPILFLELHGRYLRQRGHDPALVISQLSGYGYTHLEENGRKVTSKDIGARNFECRLVCFPE